MNSQPLRFSPHWLVWLAGIIFGFSACSPFGLQPKLVHPIEEQSQAKSTPTPVETRPNPFLSATPSPTPVIDLNTIRGQEVILWHPFAGKVAEVLNQMADEFTRQNSYGIRVSAVSVGSEDILASSPGISAGENPPHLVLAPSVLLTRWGKDGVVIPLDDWMRAPEVGLSQEVIRSIRQVFWEQDRVDQKQVGIPALRTAYGLVYNQSWAQELGYNAPPSTVDQFREQMCAAAQANNRSPYLEKRGTGGWLADFSSTTAISWLSAFGTHFEKENASVSFQFDQPGALRALQFLRKMQLDGCIWVGRNPVPQQYFAERYTLAYSGTLQMLASQQRMLSNVGSEDQWFFIPYPSADGVPIALSDGYSYGIFHSSSTKESAAWIFIAWLSRPEQRIRLNEAYSGLLLGEGQPVKTSTSKQIGEIYSTLRPAPASPDWLIVRRPLEDAFWQVFNLASEEQLVSILPQLDEMIAELSQTP